MTVILYIALNLNPPQSRVSLRSETRRAGAGIRPSPPESEQFCLVYHTIADICNSSLLKRGLSGASFGEELPGQFGVWHGPIPIEGLLGSPHARIQRHEHKVPWLPVGFDRRDNLPPLLFLRALVILRELNEVGSCREHNKERDGDGIVCADRLVQDAQHEQAQCEGDPEHNRVPSLHGNGPAVLCHLIPCKS
jgi:hypothetical protein